MRQETENYEFSRLWDRMNLVKRDVITGQMHIMAKLRSAWSRALHRPPRRTWAFSNYTTRDYQCNQYE